MKSLISILILSLAGCATNYPPKAIQSRLHNWPDARVITCNDNSAQVLHDGKIYDVTFKNNWLTGFEIQSIEYNK